MGESGKFDNKFTKSPYFVANKMEGEYVELQRTISSLRKNYRETQLALEEMHATCQQIEAGIASLEEILAELREDPQTAKHAVLSETEHRIKAMQSNMQMAEQKAEIFRLLLKMTADNLEKFETQLRKKLS